MFPAFYDILSEIGFEKLVREIFESIISSIISIEDERKRGSTTESGGFVSWNNRIPYVRCTPQKTGKKSRSASTTVRGEGSTTLAFRRLLLRNRRHFYFFLPVEFHVVIAKQAKMENVSEDVDDVKKLEAPLLLVRRGQRQGIAACTFRSVIYKAERGYLHTTTITTTTTTTITTTTTTTTITFVWIEIFSKK
ncbi:hypothetical protein V1477_011623, partial [Vespula maculifrons]